MQIVYAAIGFAIATMLLGISSLPLARASEPVSPDPAKRHRVVDVASGDELNVRGQAGTEAPVIGALKPDAGRVVVTGLRTRAGAGTWWQIVHEGAPRGTGWVNARFLAPDAETEPEAGFALHCRGNEPFWSLELERGEARFSTPEKTANPWRAGPWSDAAGLRSGHRFAIRLHDPEGSQAGWVTIARAAAYCSDQMSDFEYPYDAMLITPAHEVLAGCCSRLR